MRREGVNQQCNSEHERPTDPRAEQLTRLEGQWCEIRTIGGYQTAAKIIRVDVQRGRVWLEHASLNLRTDPAKQTVSLGTHWERVSSIERIDPVVDQADEFYLQQAQARMLPVPELPDETSITSDGTYNDNHRSA